MTCVRIAEQRAVSLQRAVEAPMGRFEGCLQGRVVRQPENRTEGVSEFWARACSATSARRPAWVHPASAAQNRRGSWASDELGQT